MKLILLLILFISVNADINFKETRHLSAIGIDRNMAGTLNYTEDIININYTVPNIENIVYHHDKVMIIKNDEENIYTFEEYPQAMYMGVILRSVLTKNYDPLINFFEVKNKNEFIYLSAKPALKSQITDIEIKYKKEKLQRVIINMSNSDTIKIETTH